MTAQRFFLTLLFTATFCILSTAAPYPEEKSMKKTTQYFLLFRKRVPCYLIDRQPSQHPLNLPIRSLSDLNCLTINSTHAKCSKTSVWFIAPSCLPWRVNLSAILSQSRPCPYLPAWYASTPSSKQSSAKSSGAGPHPKSVTQKSLREGSTIYWPLQSAIHVVQTALQKNMNKSQKQNVFSTFWQP